MISQVVDPPERLREEAQALAREDRPQLAGGHGRHQAGAVGRFELGLTDACRAGAQELVSMWGHPDQEEGPRAFAEKREPVWAPPGRAAEQAKPPEQSS